MSDQGIRDALLAVPVPDELEAQRRTWSVVRGAYAEREPVPRRGRGLRLLIAFAVVAAVVAAALSPPGRSVGGWIHDRVVGEEATEPALVRLPSAGRLLVVSEQGPWIVRPDGSKRLLGMYDDASFSPRGRFVVATRGLRVSAVDPDTSTVRWEVARPTPVADARWAPIPGYRVAYREGETLRVVGGDGEGDELLAENVAPVAPAWRPLEGRTILAYADTSGRVRVVEADGELLWSADPGATPEQLVWSDDASVLLVVTAGRRHPLYRANGRPAGEGLETPEGQDVLDAAFAPGTRELAYSAYDPDSGQSSIVIGDERIQQGEGRLEDVTFSPNGSWLLAGWPEADQLLFIRLPGVSGYVVVPDVRREFDPGGVGATEFPRIAGWCC